MIMKTRGIVPNLQLHWGNRFTSDKNVSWHSHVETELVAVTRGRCRIRVGQETVLEGTRGSLFILPAHVEQYQETLSVTHTTYIGFEAPPGLFDESARVLGFEITDPALKWIEQLCDSRLSHPPLSNEVIDSLLVALLRRISDLDTASGSQARQHPAIRLAQAHLKAHLNQPLTLAEVARAAHVSTSHLSALFAAEFGVGPIHYLQRLRMERACWLLSNPYFRIREVAEACGYEDVNYFTRLFRQSFGVAPGLWRTNRRKNSS